LPTIIFAPSNVNQSTIRAFYGFRVFDPEASRLLLKEIASMVHSQVKPKVSFWRCVDILVRESHSWETLVRRPRRPITTTGSGISWSQRWESNP
jgi:hypothetical protein